MRCVELWLAEGFNLYLELLLTFGSVRGISSSTGKEPRHRMIEKIKQMGRPQHDEKENNSRFGSSQFPQSRSRWLVSKGGGGLMKCLI